MPVEVFPRKFAELSRPVTGNFPPDRVPNVNVVGSNPISRSLEPARCDGRRFPVLKSLPSEPSSGLGHDVERLFEASPRVRRLEGGSPRAEGPTGHEHEAI